MRAVVVQPKRLSRPIGKLMPRQCGRLYRQAWHAVAVRGIAANHHLLDIDGTKHRVVHRWSKRHLRARSLAAAGVHDWDRDFIEGSGEDLVITGRNLWIGA